MINQKPAFTEKKYIVTLAFVSSLFMLWGIAHGLSDVLNKDFQNILSLSKSQSALVQFSTFGAYAVMGIPAGLFMRRFGYKKGVLLGLSLYAIGAFLFVPAANAGSFSFFRIALFVLACGLATLETTAHPFMAALGDQRTSDQRLNFAQSFNGLGTVISPLIGSFVLFQGVPGLDSVKSLYVYIGLAIVVIAFIFSFLKVPVLSTSHAVSTDTYAAAPDTQDKQPVKKLFHHRHFVWAVVAQFFNVAAQGGTWAFFINYAVKKMGFTDAHAAYFLSLFMVMMMAGRFVGTFLMRYIAPNKLLATFALANIAMCVIVAQSLGWVSFIALLMINFFFSIMFPTIFSLGLKDLGKHTQQASSFIVMGVTGGALFPYCMGLIANHDIATAYYLPTICYVVIFLFGWKLYKSQK